MRVRPLVLGLCLAASLLMLAGCEKKTRGNLDLYEKSPFLALSGEQTQIVSIDLESIRRLSIFASARDALLGNPDRSKWWSEISTDLGMPPLEKIDHIVIGNHGTLDLGDPLADAVVIMTGELAAPEAITSGIARYAAKHFLTNPPAFSATPNTVDGGILFYSTKAPSAQHPEKVHEYFVAFPSPRILVFARSRNFLIDTLNVVSGRAEGIAKQTAWQDRLKQIDLGATAWAVGDVPASVNEFIAKRVTTEPELKGLANLNKSRRFKLGISTGAQYGFDGVLTCESIEGAELLRKDMEQARGVIPRVLWSFMDETDPRVRIWQGLFERFFLKAEVNSVRISVKMERTEVENFVRRLVQAPTAATPRSIPAPFLPENQ